MATIVTPSNHADLAIDIKHSTVHKNEHGTFLVVSDSELHARLKAKLTDPLTVNVLNYESKTFGHFRYVAVSDQGALVFALIKLLKFSDDYRVLSGVTDAVTTIYLEIGI